MKIKPLIILSIILSVMMIVTSWKKLHKAKAFEPVDDIYVFEYGAYVDSFDREEKFFSAMATIFYFLYGA